MAAVLRLSRLAPLAVRSTAPTSPPWFASSGLRHFAALQLPKVPRLLVEAPAATQGGEESDSWSGSRERWLGAVSLLGVATMAGGIHAKAHPACCEETEVLKEKKPEPSLVQKCMAEAVGTGIIVHGGCGVVAAKMYANSGLNTFQVAAVWASSIALAIFSTRDISGAHLNPAVSCALAANKDFSIGELPPYILAQTLGATFAGVANYLIFQKGIAALELAEKIPRGTATSTFAGAFGMVPAEAVMTPLTAFLAEIWCTAVFAFLVFMITDAAGSIPGDVAPVLIGISAAVLITIFGPLTGCGMNPARDIGPRLAAMAAGWGSIAWSHAWIYTLGPVIGAVIGGALYQNFFHPLM